MSYCVILSKLTDEGRKTIKKNPERILQVNEELEGMGIKVIDQYALLGEFDFLNIVEVQDNETVMKMNVELGQRGTVSFLSMPAVPIEHFINMIK